MAFEVGIALKNYPSGANRWGITLYDRYGEKSISKTIYDVQEMAIFDIPGNWAWPLRFYISIIYYPNGSVTVLHQAQSVTPDWPNYIERFIDYAGRYFYNVTTREFEWIPAPVTRQLTTSVIGSGKVLPSEGVFGDGDQIILVAYPDTNNEFVQWSGDIAGCTSVPGMPNHLSVIMDRDRHIIAEFQVVAPPPPPPAEPQFRNLVVSFRKGG